MKHKKRPTEPNQLAHSIMQDVIKLTEKRIPDLLGRCPKCKTKSIMCDNLPQILRPHRTNIWCAACGWLASTDRIMPDRTPIGVSADEHEGTVRHPRSNAPR